MNSVIQTVRSTRARLSAVLLAASMPLIMLLLNPAIASAVEINEDFKPQNEFRLDQ